METTTVLFFISLVVAVILHEISHGLVALWCGDTTAQDAGRLTLNPIPHIDPFGSLFLPALGALSGVPVIAWAKPVPVNPARLRGGRRDLLIVSLAGPVTNLALAIFAAVVGRIAFLGASDAYGTFEDLPLVVQATFLFAMVNLFLGLFNFLPIPPLDGAALVERLVPKEHLGLWWRFRPYGMIVLLVLVLLTDVVKSIFDPFLDHLVTFVLA